MASAPGDFDADAELVIFTTNIHGAITAAKATAVIGSAATSYGSGDTALFVVDNGTSSAIYQFHSNGADALVSAGELTLLATLAGSPSIALGDFLFGG